MPRNSRLKLFDLVKDMVEVTEAAIAAHLTGDRSVDPALVRTIALAAAQQLCFRNAKSTCYIPEAKGLENLERNARIWMAYQVDGYTPAYARKFTPERAMQLAAEYDLSPQQIYNILKAQRADEFADIQGELPGINPGS